MQLQSRPRLTFLPEAHGIFSYDFFFEAWDLKTILEYFSCNVRVWAAKWFLIGPSQACMASIWQLTCSKKRLSDTFTALSVCWTALLESIASGWKKKMGEKKRKEAELRMRGVVFWSVTSSVPHLYLYLIQYSILGRCSFYSPDVTFNGRLNSDSKYILLRMECLATFTAWFNSYSWTSTMKMNSQA